MKKARQEKDKANKKTSRINCSELKRLVNFKEAVKYGPIFTCTVCDQDMFRHSVTILNDKEKESLSSKCSELCKQVLSGNNPVDWKGTPTEFICSTCKTELKKGNLPAMARDNKLHVIAIPEDDLKLTELESNLIAKTILFQKIFQLPKSRMAACKDRLINIPVNSQDVLNTIENIPRTPREAGLLEVKLKRKLEYKNVHQQAYIDPQKIYKALDFLKKKGHPDYLFYDDFNLYEKRCHIWDKKVKFVNDSSVDTVKEKDEYIKSLEKTSKELNEENDSDQEEEEYQKNDVVRKFQFDYDRSVCIVDKYPEAAVIEESNDNDQISFAPGEGKYPENILNSENWDTKAFPMKHPDGKNGLHQKRCRRLTDQYYFVQRLRNKDTRFSTDPAYVFAAAAYLEKKQLQRNVNVSYQRGKEVRASNGMSTFHLEDGFSVFNSIKNTPKYWKNAKYEMLARLDNLGPFNFFFTLSCADLRWDENFSCILRKLGIGIEYGTSEDEEETTYVVRENQPKMEMREYLEKHVEQSLHELIRRHVFIATRNYYNRVKAFINKILTDKNNPMCVKYWTTKVEFQGRGAGHNHGTIWVDMKKMEFTFIDKEGKWENLESLIQKSVNKSVIEEQLSYVLEKYYVKKEIIREDDSKLLHKIYQEIFQTKHEELDIEEHSDQFVEDFLNMFQLFGLSSAFKKFQTKEDLLEHEEQAVIVFADKFTTCTLNEAVIASKTNDDALKKSAKEVVEIVKKCYIHSHTKSCRKYHTECRYGIPKFPIWKTIVSKPLKVSGGEGEQLKQKYSKVLKDVKEVLKDSVVVNSIIEEYPTDQDTTLELYKANRMKRILKVLALAGLESESGIALYEEALTFSLAGYSVLVERDLSEIYVNSYNPEWARAWNGNTDLQVCLDYFAVITYITEYYTKDDTGMMNKIIEMLKNAEYDTLQDKMILVMNTFITARQMGECEAYYKILPNFKLNDSNVTVVFVPTSRKELRSKFMMRVEENEDYNGRERKQIQGKQGWYVEKYDLIDKYVRLDKTCKAVIELVPSQFLKMYEAAHKIKVKTNKPGVEDQSDPEDEETRLEEEDQADTGDKDMKMMGDEKFHYVMKASKGKAMPLPEYIALENPFPGEPPFMRKRKHPAVLRFHKPKQSVNPADYFFAEALLYTPFRSEDELERRVKNAEKDGYATLERQIKCVKDQVMEHLESNEEARYMVEEASKKTEEMGDILDPQGEQENMDCEIEDIENHPDYEHLNPDDFKATENTKQEKKYRPIEVDNLDVLLKKTRSLDFYQRVVIHKGIEFSRKVVKARNPKNTYPEGKDVIVHGGAGSGKTAVINILKQWCHILLQQPGDDPDCPYIVLAAPTGTAASKIRGQTMHSAFGFNFGNEHYSLSDKVRDKKRSLMKNLKIVIIDEISMVKSDQGFQLDKRLREITQKPDKLFGGVTIFYVGDIMQLKPCKGRYIFGEPINQDYKLEYQLGLHWRKFEVVLLEENHRQDGDKEYADMLNRFRIGQQTIEDMDVLRTRVRPLDHPDTRGAVFICCTNKEVEKLNRLRLNQIEEEKIVIEALNTHATIKNFKPTIGKKGNVMDTPFMQTLELKKGARVQLTFNIDTLDCLTNGARGVLIDFVKNWAGHVEKVMIQFDEIHQGQQKRASQTKLTQLHPGCTSIERVMFQYSLAKKSKAVSSFAKVMQFPLSLCFAATCHRFQGQTVYEPNKTVNDFRTVFQAAQGYVMLSRVESLNQLFILGDPPDNKFYANHQALEELERLDRVSINRNKPIWEQALDWSRKISLLNCRSLMMHIEDIKKDPILSFSDIICLNETWLKSNMADEQLNIPGFELHLNSSGAGKGIGTYFKSGLISPQVDITKSRAQITLLSSSELDVVNVYRSQGMSNAELAHDLKDIINKSNLTIICGDFNICYVDDRDNEVTRMLEYEGFSQLVHEATHFKGGHIDHVYSNHNPKDFQIAVSLYSPYYLAKDHDAICVTIIKNPVRALNGEGKYAVRKHR